MSTIVAIDDNPAVRALLESCLRIEGHRPVTLPDGLDMDRIRAEAPALVILDMRLPGRSGLDVLAAMRDDEALKSVPVVLISGVPPTGPIDDNAIVLAKPFDIGDLSRQVSRLLGGVSAPGGETRDVAPLDDDGNSGILGAVTGPATRP